MQVSRSLNFSDYLCTFQQEGKTNRHSKIQIRECNTIVVSVGTWRLGGTNKIMKLLMPVRKGLLSQSAHLLPTSMCREKGSGEERRTQQRAKFGASDG